MTFIKHPEENNKDHAAVQQIVNTHKRIGWSRYYQSTHLKASNTKSVMNERVKQTFGFIAEEIKALHSKLPDKQDRVIIEINPARWSTISYIITNSMYFSLECDGTGQFKVEYLFHHSPFEEHIKGWMKRLLMNSYSVECVSIPDFPEFYRRMLRTQPEHHIFLL